MPHVPVEIGMALDHVAVAFLQGSHSTREVLLEPQQSGWSSFGITWPWYGHKKAAWPEAFQDHDHC